MAEARSRGGKGCPKLKHLGARKARIQHYYLYVFPQRKLRRILKHAGEPDARAWATNHDCLGVLKKMLEAHA